MGSAQSARRIQPGGGSGRAGGPADLSRPPFLPTPPPALPPPSSLLPGGGLRRVRGWAGGAGGGVGGGPPPGRRPAAAGRISTAAVRRDRLRDGWEGRRGRWLGGPRSLRGAGPPPECYSPPAAALAESRGRGSRPSPRSPPSRRPPPRGLSREGVPPAGARRCRGGRAAPPTARPLPHPPRPRRRGARGGGADCPQCAPGGSRRRARGVSRRHAVTKAQRSERTGSAAMSATHPTRLETRTKESNTCASQGLARKPPWRNEGEGRRCSPAEVGSRGLSSPPRAHHRPVSPAAPGRWSMSARVRTRKMVNYAWAGRSQRKLWWRSVAVLTCKSVVRPGYRGERLIEPSSSWFPPKFPSG